MSAENTIREALHDGLKLRSVGRVEKYQRAEGALNALVAAHAAALKVVEVARTLEQGTPVIDMVAMLRRYDAVVAALPKISDQ